MMLSSPRSMSLSFCRLWLVFVVLANTSVTALPSGFQDVGVAHVRGCMDVEELPVENPDTDVVPIMVVNKEGLLWIIDDPEAPSEPRIIGDISDRLCTNGSRGFMSVIPHPDFLTNRWLYFYYVGKGNVAANPCAEYNWEAGPINHIARVKMRDDYTLDMSTEETLLWMTPGWDDLHVGGDMLFGVDGNLWVTTGEVGYKPYGQMTHELQGALIRLTPEGDIPFDNPFQASQGYDNTARCNVGNQLEEGMICEETWAYGLRSPYRFARDPNAVGEDGEPIDRFFFMDVGGISFEEINEAGTNFSGVNYGTPIYEGPCDKSNGDNNLDCSVGVLGDTQLPYHWYQRNPGGDAAAVGGAFVPNGLWPQEYDDSFLWSDYPRDTIFHLWYNESAACLECEASPVPPTTNVTFLERNKINAMKFIPYRDTQALYYTSRDASLDYTVRRVTYEVVEPPECDLQTNIGAKGYADVNTAVRFDARGSTHPDNLALTFAWTFGDGGTSNNALQDHVYTSKGEYIVELTVTDTNGLTCNDRETIKVGEPPSVNMLSPPEGTEFAVGEIFTLLASAEDSGGNSLDDSHLTWEMRRHHNLHYHPWLAPFVGNNFDSIAAPPPEDLPSALNSYVEIIVTATDDDGLTTSLSRNIMPKMVEIDLEVVPAGLPVNFFLSNYLLTPPLRVPMWDNEVTSLVAPDVPGYNFAGWSDGGAQTHDITIPPAGPGVPVYTATYLPVGGGPVPTPAPSRNIFAAGIVRLITCAPEDYEDAGGNLWESDSAYTSNGVYKSYAGPIAGTSEPGLYQSWREEDPSNPSNLFFAIPFVVEGDFVLEFHFMEPAHEATGIRVVDVYAEGSLVGDDVDIFAETGSRYTAYTMRVPVTIAGGILAVRLTSRSGFSVLSGIAIYEPSPPTLPPVSAPPTPSPLAGGGDAVVRITCGTDQEYEDTHGNIWMPDGSFTSKGLEKTYGGTIANTAEQGLFQTWREEDGESPSNLFYSIPVPEEGDYIVQLYFLDPEYDVTGQRLMDIYLEGVLVEEDFDIVEAAMGQYTAVVMEFPATIDMRLALRLSSIKDQWLLCGIAILTPGGGPGPSPVAMPTPPPVAPPTLVGAVVARITCGTGEDYTDSDGNVWISDDVYANSGLHSTHTDAVANTNEQGLFQTYRQEDTANKSNLFYRIPVPANGNYIVHLYFMDPDFGMTGERTMDIYIEGVLVEEDFDIVQAAPGQLSAYVMEIPTTVTGPVTVRLTSTSGLWVISAVAIVEA